MTAAERMHRATVRRLREAADIIERNAAADTPRRRQAITRVLNGLSGWAQMRARMNRGVWAPRG